MLILILIIGWYLVGYNLTFDFIVPGSQGYGSRWKDWLALFVCATLWPLIVLGMIIRLWQWLRRK